MIVPYKLFALTLSATWLLTGNYVPPRKAKPQVTSSNLANNAKWQQAEIGAPPTTGSTLRAGKALRITGTGMGLNIGGKDQGHYVYLVLEDGNFEVSARLSTAQMEVNADANIGIVVRSLNEPDSPMAGVTYRQKNNSLNWISRFPGKPPRVLIGGIEILHKLPQSANATADSARRPVWLRLVRHGGNFAVYKSPDGKLWLPISNVSGGPFGLKGPLKVGLFVSSGTADASATATFDNIKIGPEQMHYRTSWVGNSFGSRDFDSHVSNGLSAMWVSPDGTCYTSSYWDEGGQPVTSYKNGKVARPLPIGTPQTNEGGITGDSKYIYVAVVDRIVRLDPVKSDFAPFDIPLSVNLLDKKTNSSAISGMASDGKELFIADARENVVRVAAAEAVPTYHRAQAANDGIANTIMPVAVPTGAGFAPAVVYQSQRVGEGNGYTFPGFAPTMRYSIRCHLAEFVDRPANCDPRNRRIDIAGTTINVAEAAGGVRKAYFVDIPIVSDSRGVVSFGVGSYGGPGICGIEIRSTEGKRMLAVNCGGIPVDDWKGESQEKPERTFAFNRPGPIAVDKRGDLWIVQRGNDFPIGQLQAAKYPAAIKCYTADGKFTGRQVTDVVNPRAVAYDAARDEIIVGDNGPDLNVRIYSGLATKPMLARTFGAKGGIYAGKHPGKVIDETAGGAARFAGISGVGVDRRGNLYVGGGFQGTDLRSFSPAGKLSWEVHSLMFCCTYDFDPASNGTEIYGTYNHLHLDLNQPTPGKEQSYAGYNWHWQRFGEPDRPSNSQAILRRLGNNKQLIMYTTSQGDVGEVKIYRYDGEIAIPAGGVVDNRTALWCDLNGDGKVQSNEVVKMASGLYPTGVSVDSRGDMWVVCTATDGSFMRHFTCKGLTAAGVPIYSGKVGVGYEDVRLPEEGGKVNGWGMASRIDYNAEEDRLIAYFPEVPRKGENDKAVPEYVMARYDNFRKGGGTRKWKVRGLRPESDPEYFMYEVNVFPYSGYMGLQACGNFVFFAYLFGEIHVFDINTGKLVEILSPGPEVNGQGAWEDASMGLRVTKTKSGEYLVLTENSGWGGKNHFYRWKP